jgi:hypothetical protein
VRLLVGTLSMHLMKAIEIRFQEKSEIAEWEKFVTTKEAQEQLTQAGVDIKKMGITKAYELLEKKEKCKMGEQDILGKALEITTKVKQCIKPAEMSGLRAFGEICYGLAFAGIGIGIVNSYKRG